MWKRGPAQPLLGRQVYANVYQLPTFKLTARRVVLQTVINAVTSKTDMQLISITRGIRGDLNVPNVPSPPGEGSQFAHDGLGKGKERAQPQSSASNAPEPSGSICARSYLGSPGPTNYGKLRMGRSEQGVSWVELRAPITTGRSGPLEIKLLGSVWRVRTYPLFIRPKGIGFGQSCKALSTILGLCRIIASHWIREVVEVTNSSVPSNIKGGLSTQLRNRKQVIIGHIDASLALLINYLNDA